MCLLCIEIAKGKITFPEVGKALGEFTIPKEHVDEFEDLVVKTWPKEVIELLTGTHVVYKKEPKNV